MWSGPFIWRRSRHPSKFSLFFRFAVMSSQTRRIVSAIAMFLCALSLQWAATAPWGEAAAADGTRYRISPIGIAHVVAPNEPSTPTIDCRWWPKVGTQSLCAVVTGYENAYKRLRLVYPGVQVALWMSVAAIFLQALRIPKSRTPHVVFTLVLLAIIVAVIATLRTAPGQALDVLQGIELRFSSLGFLLGSAAAALSLLSLFLLAEPTSRASRLADGV